MRGSTATVWSWSTGCLRNDSWKSRHAIAIVGTSQVTEETRREICKIVAWDMKQLEAGVYDVVNHTGRFHPLGSKREKLAGEKFSMKAVARLFKMIGEPPNELAQVQSSDVFMRHITNAIYSTCRVWQKSSTMSVFMTCHATPMMKGAQAS